MTARARRTRAAAARLYRYEAQAERAAAAEAALAAALAQTGADRIAADGYTVTRDDSGALTVTKAPKVDPNQLTVWEAA